MITLTKIKRSEKKGLEYSIEDIKIDNPYSFTPVNSFETKDSYGIKKVAINNLENHLGLFIQPSNEEFRYEIDKIEYRKLKEMKG